MPAIDLLKAAFRKTGVDDIASAPADTNAAKFYPKQQEFIDNITAHSAFIGGIGSGKSYAGVVRAIAAAEGRIGNIAVRTPNLGMITAPTYPMLRDATQRAFFEVAGSKIAEFRKSENIVRLTNGSEIIFRSADNPERLRGPNLTWWFGDEAALYIADAWRIMIGRLRQHGQRGYAWIATTPKGRNWVWQEFVERERADYRLFKIKTTENPFLSPEFVSGLQEAYVGDFAAQELEGEFVAFEGLIYAEFRRDVHIVADAGHAFSYYVAGVDWGYANPGVILVFGVDSDGRMTLVNEQYQRQLRIEEWAEIAAQLNQQYRIQTFFCDPAEPDFIEMFRQRHVNAIAANNEVLTGIQVVKNRLVTQGDGKPRLQIVRGAVHVISEFESYIWMEHKHDGMQDKPRKSHDHALDALRYACMGVEEESTALYGAVSHQGANYGAIGS